MCTRSLECPEQSQYVGTPFLDPSCWNSILHLSVQGLDLKSVLSLISAGFPVNLPNLFGASALHLAVEADDGKIVETLLQYGADPLLCDDEHRSPLLLAISSGKQRSLELLLQSLPDLDPRIVWTCHLTILQARNLCLLEVLARHGYTTAKTKEPTGGGTLLHAFVGKTGYVDIVRRLVEDGVDVCAQDINGVTALHIAAQKSSDPRVLRLLLEAGADPNAHDFARKGTPIFGLASIGGLVQNAEVLLDYGATLLERYGPGRTLLHLAAQDGNLGLIQLFIERGIDANVEDDTGSKAARWAAQKGHTDALKLMARLGMNFIKPDRDGIGALTAAVVSGRIDTVSYVLTQGADANEGSGSPMHAALQRGNLEIAHLLLNHGAVVEASNLNNPESRDNREDVSALLFCCTNGAAKDLLPPYDATVYLNGLLDIGKPTQASVVIAAGANVTGLPAKYLSQVSLVSATYGLLDAFPRLIAAGVDRNATAAPDHWTALHIAADRGTVNLIRMLRLHGWKMQAKDRFGRTALHVGAAAGHSDVVEEFLGETDVNIGDKDGNTPLHWACRSGDCETISLLIQAGASLCGQNAERCTPLQFCCMHGHVDATVLMLQNTNDLEKGDLSGNTPLHCAVNNNHLGVVTILLQAGANVNPRRLDASTPLHLAAYHGFSSIAQELLKLDADEGALTTHNDSALDLALVSGHTELAMLLFERSEAGMTKNTLLYALQAGNADIAMAACAHQAIGGGDSVLASAREFAPQLLADALHRNKKEVCNGVEETIMSTLPIQHQDSDFFNLQLLMFSIKNGSDASPTKSLLEETPGITNRTSLGGWTPLHLACRLGRLHHVMVLLDHGAQSTAKLNGSGLTPREIGERFAPESDVVLVIDRYNGILQAITKLRETGFVQKNAASEG